MNRLRWLLHKHSATFSYLFVVAIVAGLFAIALWKGGHW